MTVRLENHSSDLVFKAIERMVADQGFKLNEDLSGTIKGKAKEKEFKVSFAEVERADTSNRQNYRVDATVEIQLLHNAQRGTSDTKQIVLRDCENLIYEIEFFNPKQFTEAKPLIVKSDFERWNTEAATDGDDSRLLTTLTFTVTYNIRNPKAT